MKYNIVGHLNDYNLEKNTFVATDWVANMGATGWADGKHFHLATIEKDSPATITDFYRGTNLHTQPDTSAIDLSRLVCTLGWLGTWEPTYTADKPHLGEDWSYTDESEENKKLIVTKNIIIIEKGSDEAFGNYIIYVVEDQTTSAPEQPAPSAPTTFQAVRENRNSDNGTFTFSVDYRGQFIPNGDGSYTTSGVVAETNGETWIDGQYFNRIIE